MRGATEAAVGQDVLVNPLPKDGFRRPARCPEPSQRVDRRVEKDERLRDPFFLMQVRDRIQRIVKELTDEEDCGSPYSLRKASLRLNGSR